jgi:hypothetical protein
VQLQAQQIIRAHTWTDCNERTHLLLLHPLSRDEDLIVARNFDGTVRDVVEARLTRTDTCVRLYHRGKVLQPHLPIVTGEPLLWKALETFPSALSFVYIQCMQGGYHGLPNAAYPKSGENGR